MTDTVAVCMRHKQWFALQAHYAKWSEVLKLERPGPTDRANCPSGGYEFAQTVWRYVRLLAVAARTQGAKLSDDPVEFHKLDGYLDAYLQALQVHSHRHLATLCLGAQRSGMVAAEAAQVSRQSGSCTLNTLAARVSTIAMLPEQPACLQEAESKVVPEEQSSPPAVYICEHKGLAQIYLLTAQARVAFLRGQNQVLHQISL